MNIPGYKFEYENNTFKRRVDIYIKDSIKYERRLALEDLNSHIIVVDLIDGERSKKRIINVYRSFNTRNESAKDLFARQLVLLKNSFINNTVILGDLNLDYKKGLTRVTKGRIE